MSSVTSSVASAYHGARFFVSIKSGAEMYDVNGHILEDGMTANTVVRDMGKTIRTPGISALGVQTNQVILRKVAVANTNSSVLPSGGVAKNFVGFSDGDETPSNPRSVFYINLYDGSWVSVSL